MFCQYGDGVSLLDTGGGHDIKMYFYSCYQITRFVHILVYNDKYIIFDYIIINLI